MKRLGRWTLNTLTVLSLLLCVGTVGLWVRSHRICDTYTRIYGRWYLRIDHTRGAWHISAWRDRYPWQPPKWESEEAWDRPRMPQLPGDPGIRSAHSFPGFSWFITDGGIHRATQALVPAPDGPGMIPDYANTYSARRYVYFRDSLLVPAFALLAAIGTARWLSTSHPIGTCRTCSYDLTGNVSGICPECGTAAKGAAT